MVEVIVGVALTAVLGGLLVPVLKGRIDRRRERFQSSLALVEVLATGLWTYWKLALRVAYYGRQGPRGEENFAVALQRWDSDESWANGCEIQVQVSRSKRLLGPEAQEKLDQAQRAVVDYLDAEIDRLRLSATPDDWQTLYHGLMTAKRLEIDSLLEEVTEQLNL